MKKFKIGQLVCYHGYNSKLISIVLEEDKKYASPICMNIYTFVKSTINHSIFKSNSQFCFELKY